MGWLHDIGIILIPLNAIAIQDLFQKQHSVRRNFPVIGHGRYLLEELGAKIFGGYPHPAVSLVYFLAGCI